MVYKRLITFSLLIAMMFSVSIYRSLAFNGKFEHLSGPEAPFALEMTNSSDEHIIVVNNRVVDKFSGLFSMDDASFLGYKEQRFLTMLDQGARDFTLSDKYVVKWSFFPPSSKAGKQKLTVLNRETRKEQIITLPFINCAIENVMINNQEMVVLASFVVPKSEKDGQQLHAITVNLATGVLQTKKAPTSVLSNSTLVDDILYAYNYDTAQIHRFSTKNQTWDVAVNLGIDYYTNISFSRHYAIYGDLKKIYIYDLRKGKQVRQMKINGDFVKANVSDKYIQIVTSEQNDNRIILTLYPLDKTKEKSVYRTPYTARVNNFLK